MEYLVYTNSDDATQIFVGILLIVGIAIVIGANIYYWISDLIKKYKNKNT